MKEFPPGKPDWVHFALLSVSSSPEDQENLREALSEAPFRITCAASCAEAFERMLEERPAVIACEQRLPDGSWQDLLRLVSNLREPPPVVVLSRNADEWLWAEVLQCGGYDVLARPLDRKEMTRVLGSACRPRRMAASA